jgi:hypothetical protein
VLLVQIIALAVSAVAAFALRLVIGTDHQVVLVLVFVLVWLWLSLLGWLLVTVLWPVLRGGRTPAMGWCGSPALNLSPALAGRPLSRSASGRTGGTAANCAGWRAGTRRQAVAARSARCPVP